MSDQEIEKYTFFKFFQNMSELKGLSYFKLLVIFFLAKFSSTGEISYRQLAGIAIILIL